MVPLEASKLTLNLWSSQVIYLRRPTDFERPTPLWQVSDPHISGKGEKWLPNVGKNALSLKKNNNPILPDFAAEEEEFGLWQKAQQWCKIMPLPGHSDPPLHSSRTPLAQILGSATSGKQAVGTCYGWEEGGRGLGAGRGGQWHIWEGG